MKKYEVKVTYTVYDYYTVYAESEDEARDMARQEADDDSLNEFKQLDAQTDIEAAEELSEREVKRMENEKVQEFVSEYVEQQTPTEVHDIAEGYGVNWLEWTGDDETAFYNGLFHAISSCEHPRTAIFERYARMYARRRWQEVAREQAREWDEAFQKAKADPEGTRVIVETNEQDPTAPENEFGRYFMVDFWKAEDTGEQVGRWVVIRSDVVTSPYEVRRPNFLTSQHYADNATQPHCRCSNPNNVTRWAERMIKTGRVVSIYADCY